MTIEAQGDRLMTIPWEEWREEWPKALVVFSGETRIWWLRLLKPGFRHCFVVLGNDAGWISVDPLSNRTIVSIMPVEPEFDLASALRRNGHVVIVTTPTLPPMRAAPWRPYSCVESVKRILGLHAGWVLTPWQLHNFLIGKENMLDDPE